MARGWVWLQLAIAWLPMWVLFAALVVMVHGLSIPAAAIVSFRMIGPGAILGIGVYGFASRMPWPYPFRIAFVGIHVLAAIAYAVSWFALVSLLESAIEGRLAIKGSGIGLFLLTGVWLYLTVAGVAYANLAARRTAMMRAQAARMQLENLRSQLHPHFLFNALHTVVQLIPVDPKAASTAAEQLADALRIAIDERRDLVPLAQEWAFVERYLAIEGIRFGERLNVRVSIEDAARELLLPSFALQTLVENSVRHGAAPRVEATTLHVSATATDRELTMHVSDDGMGVDIRAVGSGAGSGLRRLRERMRWLYGDRARLELASEPGRGFAAMLVVPQSANVADATLGGVDDGHA